MAVEVELVGGPHDGVRTVIEGDPMDPPRQIETLHPSQMSWHASDDEYVGPHKLLYQREVGPSTGALWVYRIVP